MPGRRAEPRLTRRPSGVPALTRLGRAEEGATAVEFAFVAPILLALVIGAVEIANIILVQFNITSVARDAVRRLAVEALSEAEAEAFIAERLRSFTAATPSVEVDERQLGDDEVEVHVSIAVSVADAMVVSRGLLSGGGGTVERPPADVGGSSAAAPAATGAGGPDVGSGGGGGRLQLGASATMLKE
jgi:Flp pilus assembly protein TadG